MKNRRGLIRMAALLVCLVMIGTLLPVIASAELPTPVLTGATASGSGIMVTWSAVPGADGYKVYRKTAGTGWVGIGTTTGTSYRDGTAKEKVTYTYTVRAMSGGKVDSGYNKTGVSAAWNNSTAGNTATPKLVSAKAESNGIRFKWKKVNGATGYRVYRKSTGGWAAIADVGNVDNYLDTTTVSGTKYTYTVRSLKGSAVKSAYDKKGVSATWNSGLGPGELKAPKLVSAVAEGSGLRVTWQAVAGASSYRVYRKHGKGNWTSLVSVTGTSYLDNATNAGEVYYYTVRCEDGDGNLISKYDKNGVKGSWTAPTPGNLATPNLTGTKNVVSGVQVSWGAVPGAFGYRVYRKTSGGGWNGIADVPGTSYTDTSAVGGNTYYYTVRALDAGGKIASAYDKAGIKAVYYATPELVSAQSVSNGIKFTWKASAGAKLYVIYRKTTGSFSRLAYTTGTSFTDKKVTEGTEYTYTVRVITENKKTLLSDYDHTGVSATFTGKSAVTNLVNKLGGVEITWAAVAGAADYQVLRKSGEGNWVQIAITGGTTWLDNEAVNNTTHTYRVRARDGAGNYIGSDDVNGVSITYYVAPTLVNCVRSSGGLLTTWEAVAGISNYVIYRRYGVGTWERVGTSTGTTYLDTTPPSGTFCYYTVRCADGAGDAISDYRTPGVGQTSYMDQPILSAAVNGNGTITVYWNSVDKATNYRVYRKTGNKTSWDVVENNTTALSYNDAAVLRGETYTYSVCVIKADGSEELSEFNSNGVKVSYYDPPTLTLVTNGKTGVDLYWNVVDYSSTYHVYRKTGNNVDWVSVGTSTSNKFTDTAVTSNAHYIYAVRSMVGGSDASALSNQSDITYYAAPKMTGIKNNNGSVTITWNQEAGIDTYRVYRSINGSAPVAIADLNAVTYTDTTANTVGNTYSYAVKCIKGGAEVSALNTSVHTIYIAPVINLKAVNASSGTTHKAKITFTTVAGDTGYYVYRKSNGTGWTKVATVTKGTLTDTVPSEGYYQYKVVAIRSGSSSADSAVVGVTVN